MEVGRTQQSGRSGQPMPGEKRQSSSNQSSGSYQGSSSYKQDNYSSTYQNKPSNSGRQSQSDPVYQNKPSNNSSYQRDPVYQNKPSNSTYQNKPNNSYQNDPVYQNKPSNQTYQNKPNNSYQNDPVYQNRPSNQTYQNKPRYNDYDYDYDYDRNRYNDYDYNRYNRPTIVIGTVREDMINASVNAMYSSVGASGIRATDAAARKLDNNYDGYVSKSEMKEALRYDRVALSLKNHDNSYGRYWDAQEVSSDVARRMDQADGYRDGFVDMSVFGDFFSGWDSWLGVARGGITTSELSSRLATGDLVIGGSIRTRSNARNSGFTIAELHQNANGPKMTIAAY
jgi:hypothetical protein